MDNQEDDLEEKLKARKEDFKRGIDQDESRRRREQTTVELRKKKREQHLQKRRLAADGMLARFASDPNAPLDPAMEEKVKMLPSYAAQINSNDYNQQLDGTISIRKLLSVEKNPPIQHVINADVVGRLAQFLTYDRHPPLQFEAAWALTNIASGTTDHTQHIVQHGGIELFVQLLKSHNPDIREQAVWGLGNIAGDSCANRDKVLMAQALPPLVQLCHPDNNPKPSLLRNATWTLSNLCRGKPQPKFELVSPAVPMLAHLLFSQDNDVLTDACWALSYLSDDSGPTNNKINAVVRSGCVKLLVLLLTNPSPAIVVPALRTIGNIVTGDDLQTQLVLNHHVIPALRDLIQSRRRGIRKEACWTISNITAGNAEQIQKVIDGDIIPLLLELLKNGEPDVKKEAAWAICNATAGGDDAQIRQLVKDDVVPALCELLTAMDYKIVLVALEGIENVLNVGEQDKRKNKGINAYRELIERCGGLQRLEALSDHESDEVYNKAEHILKTFFDFEVEEDDVDAVEPAANANSFGFGVSSDENIFE